MTDLKLLDALKDLGGVLATLAGLAYASGYLVLRARARALGTDPSLGLLEETYVFAGFRFFLVLLILVILTLPLIAAFRAAMPWLIRVVPAAAQEPAQWAAVFILSVMVLIEFRVLGVNNVLLENDPGRLADAVLGRNTLGFLLVLGTAGLTALSFLWFDQHYGKTELSLLSISLAVLVTLQVLLLPIYHGFFFADRSVRVLDGVPAQVPGLVAPVGIVDRGGDYVEIFGANKDGERILVMIGKDDLKGVGIRNVTSLRTFLDMLPQVPSK